MPKFVARTTAPSTTDKHWIHTSKGGLNECILISGNSVLPNCVGYAWGRAYELLGKRPKLSKNNAENWWGYNDGYTRSQTPKLGSIVCWRKGQAGNGNDGAGHVAVVEAIYSDGTILCSNSAYGGSRFYTKRINPKTWPGGSYIFQGYIHPDYNFETVPTGKVGKPVMRDKSKNQVEVLIDDLRARKRPEINDAVILGYANKGIYNVLEQRDMTHEASNGYLWYRIDADMWVAAKEGEWTKFYPAEAQDSERVKKLEAELAAANKRATSAEKLATEYKAKLIQVHALSEV
jgi:surface antigen